MTRFLHRLLGLNMIQDQLDETNAHLRAIDEAILALRNDLAVTFLDEQSPKRKELSNELGRRAIARLQAEDKARRHTLGEI